MKAKAAPTFTSKLSQQLAKFKDSSTVAIAHEQIRKLLGEYSFPQIVNQFAGKMDSCDRLSEREKRQYAKIYITMIDAYGAETLYQQYYQRFMESLNKKTVGVGDVIGHLCKNLLSRIHPPENAIDYISHLLILFKNHSEVCKIAKHIVQSMDATILAQFQQQLVTIVADKMQSAKLKSQPMEALLAIILAYEDSFQFDLAVHSIVTKYYKNEDYNVRKTCVDICYAMMVVKQQANAGMHRVVKELKYDKIKHVRDAVCNYFALYKQIYGEQEQSRKSTNSKVEQSRNKTTTPRSKMPEFAPPSPISGGKSKRNENFFQNAKESTVIKLPEDNKSSVQVGHHPREEEEIKYQNQQQGEQQHHYARQIVPRQNSSTLHQIEQYSPRNSDPLPNTFKDYLKNRTYTHHQTTINPRIKPSALTQNLDFSQYDVKKKPNFSQIDYQHHSNANIYSHDERQTKKRSEKLEKGKIADFISQQGKKVQVQSPKGKNTENMKIVESSRIQQMGSSSSKRIDAHFSRRQINQGELNENTLPTQSKKMTQQQIKQLNLAELILGLKKSLMSKLEAIDGKLNQIDNRVSRIQAYIQKQENIGTISTTAIQKKETFRGSNGKQKNIEGMKSIVESQIPPEHETEQFPAEETTPFDCQGQNQQATLQNQKIKQCSNNSQQLRKNSLGNSKTQNQRQKYYKKSDCQQHDPNGEQNMMESNLREKVGRSIKERKWDEAYSIVLANNDRSLLLQMLDSAGIPKDPIVQECLLMEVRKSLNSYSALKWFKNYISERNLPKKTLKKFKMDIQKIDTQQLESLNKQNFRGYLMLKKMVLEQIEEMLQQ